MYDRLHGVSDGLHTVDGLGGLNTEHGLSPIVARGCVESAHLLLCSQSIVQHCPGLSLGVGVDDGGVVDVGGLEVPDCDQLHAGHARKQEIVDV